MLSYVSLIAALAFAWRGIKILLSLNRNIAAAKASGIPYRVAPVSGLPGFLWIAFQDLFLKPLDKFIPASRNWLWPKLIQPDRSWQFGHELQEALGEVYLIVSPFQIFLSSCHPETNHQITNRRQGFFKPVEVYAPADIYGTSILTSEGEEWRRHRKIVAPAFSERNNSFVWKESIKQATGMVDSWSRMAGNSTQNMKIADTSYYTEQLTLHITCAAAFGVRQFWDGEDESQIGSTVVPGFSTTKLIGNYKMTFKDSLQTLLHGVIWVCVLPNVLLRNSPFETHRKVAYSYKTCARYFEELAEWKLQNGKSGDEGDLETLDTIMGPLIQASEYVPGNKADGRNSEDSILTRREVLSDSWIILFAGHDTTALASHSCLVWLAISRDKQALLQRDIDNVIGTRASSNWNYEIDSFKLWNSMVGAVIQETIRLNPPVLDIPKIVRDVPQQLTYDGKSVTVPAHTIIHLSPVPIGRNPKYWPTKPSRITSKTNDLDDFVPERWLPKDYFLQNGHVHDEQNAKNGNKDNDGFKKSILFTPPRGVAIQFSDGARSCPGKRFAQVELTAILSVIFKSYTLELDVSEWACDEKVKRMSIEQKRKIYAKAVERVRELMRRSKSIGVLRMGGKFPVRLMRRGSELFGRECFV